MQDGAMISLKHVSRRFGHILAINDLDLAINKGELFGVVGPDGSGKTTLLRMMAAVLDPSDPRGKRWLGKISEWFHPPIGHISIGGHDTVASSEAVKAQLGYMPQNFGLYDDLSVDENLAFVADVFGLKGKERAERIHTLLAFANLEQVRSRPARLLSGGMKKKLALACALVHRPAVLLLDEPTTGVDPLARRSSWELLSRLHAEGITTVVSTPYMDEAERCNRVALLFAGRILACDTPEAIKRQVPGQVLALQGADVRQAAHCLQDLPAVLGTQTYGNQLNLIVTGDLPAVRRLIADRLATAKLSFDSLDLVPVRMEEAFIYLVNLARQQHKED
jgi:ABC-2 type transport system ATP-binding protein